MNYMSPDNKWIGKPTIRPDGIEKVTGSAQYAADYTMPGMVWGKVLRSPHARINKENRYLKGRGTPGRFSSNDWR